MTQCRHRRAHAAVALLAAVALSTGAAMPALADDDQSTPVPTAPSLTSQTTSAALNLSTTARTARSTDKWFVELEATPKILGGSTATIQAQQKAFIDSVADVEVTVEDTFSELWTGVIVSADEAALTSVKNSDHVKSVFPVLQVSRYAESSEGEPGSITSGTSRGTSGTPHSESSRLSASSDKIEYTGKGVKIGVIDTGIDIDHPALGGTGVPNTTEFPNDKIIAGYDFVGDDYNDDSRSSDYNPIPAPDSIPDDCNGHGTHVAGIAAGHDAKSRIFGMAPEATLGAYKVFGCTGTTSSEIILAAMEQAKADGMDVINMSFGADFAPWPNYPTSAAADNLVKAGINVVVAQGNLGALGVFSGGAPASAHDVIAVGSVDNAPERQGAFRVADNLYGYVDALQAPAAPIEGDIELAAYPEGQESGAVDLPGTPLTGKAVLISAGIPEFSDQIAAAQADGAEAVILYRPQSEIPLGPDLYLDEAVSSPVVTVSMNTGAQLRSAMKEAGDNAVVVTWTSDWAWSEPEGSSITSEFSSWGVSGDLEIKPDILAPGSNRQSAYPLDAPDSDGSGVTTMTGTSMATPYVAGSIALLLQAKPELDPANVKALLLNHASPVISVSDQERRSILKPIHHQGAGEIGIIDAGWFAHPEQGSDPDDSPQPIMVTPAKINLADSDEIETTTLTITNPGELAVVYFLHAYDNVETTTGPNGDTSYGYAQPDMEGRVTFSGEAVSFGNEVMVPAGESRDIEVTIHEPEAYKDSKGTIKPGSWYGGFISVTGFDSSQATIPFLGMTGDYETDRTFIYSTYGEVYGQETVAGWGMDPNEPYMSPSLATSCVSAGNCTGGGFDFVDDGYVFDFEAGDIPGVAIHIENPVRKLTVEAFHANDDGTKGAPVSAYGPFYISNGEGTFPYYDLYQWDATVQVSDDPADRRLVEPGRYVIEVTATKGMGHATKGSATETWLSPSFTVTGVPSPEQDVVLLDNGWDGENTVSWPIMPGFQVLSGDWDGDGKDTLMFREGNNFSYINSLGDEPVSFIYGRAGDEVLVGDWDADGKDTIAVRRGVTNYYRNSLSGGPADGFHNFGRVADHVLVGDWDGDGSDTVSVHRGRTFFVNNSLTGTHVAGFIYGRDGDVPLGGDWDGDGTDTFSVIRGTTIFINNTLRGGNIDAKELALAGDVLLVGDWDGNGTDTLGVVRGSVKG